MLVHNISGYYTPFHDTSTLATRLRTLETSVNSLILQAFTPLFGQFARV
jgi:hypothetical protein